jgi:hypothetical protein
MICLPTLVLVEIQYTSYLYKCICKYFIIIAIWKIHGHPILTPYLSLMEGWPVVIDIVEGGRKTVFIYMSPILKCVGWHLSLYWEIYRRNWHCWMWSQDCVHICPLHLCGSILYISFIWAVYTVAYLLIGGNTYLWVLNGVYIYIYIQVVCTVVYLLIGGNSYLWVLNGIYTATSAFYMSGNTYPISTYVVVYCMYICLFWQKLGGPSHFCGGSLPCPSLWRWLYISHSLLYVPWSICL